MHPGDRAYRNQLVRLSDLTVTHDVLDNITFEHCQIVGPAVIILVGDGLMQDTAFDGEPDAVLWPLGDRQRVTGAIVLQNCTIVACRFVRVGLAYPASEEGKIRAGFGL